MQRVTEIDYSGGKTLFSYDPLGRRVKKIDENGSGAVLSTFSYHYDGSEVAVEYQPSTTWTYYLGLGIDHVVMRDSGSTKQWYYRDGHGSTSAVADNSGNLLEAYEYNAQGQFKVFNASGTLISATAIANDILYTGREYDNAKAQGEDAWGYLHPCSAFSSDTWNQVTGDTLEDRNCLGISNPNTLDDSIIKNKNAKQNTANKVPPCSSDSSNGSGSSLRNLF